MSLKIFVEGIADQKFLHDFILQHYSQKLGYNAKSSEENDIIGVNGWGKIYEGNNGADNLIINQMTNNTDNDGINLLIFDADDDYQERLNQIETWREENELEFEIFLFPNGQDPGDLETLLEGTIAPQNSAIFDCWDGYEQCISQINIEGRENSLTIPARKTKIYGYLEVLHGESNSQKEKIKERNRNYRKTDFWDLNADVVQNLKTFLDPYFNQ
ncbi:hypothetical protein MY04_4150 [Flammeovirga sp. MY04]|uniref:DUF3226 domain-containing protein n=1 Tax=Flammeovirga sp. MY04 TaxID=1191459 RepID=UPI00080633B3|nr:DUF3226 domain-containing protein [Flammeovirga sp. MY04]ANQ51494.1 hypothetical protein MY04_4150 [Flammeovirga sp. MY04]